MGGKRDESSQIEFSARGGFESARTAMAKRPKAARAQEPSSNGRRPNRSVNEAAETRPAN